MESKRLSKQLEVMAKKLADTKSQNTILLAKLKEKDKEVSRLSKLLHSKKDDGKCTVESTKAHLQGQLHRREAENNRLTVQIKRLKETVEQQKGEVSRLREQLKRPKIQAAEPEIFKRAAEVCRRRAELSEDVAARMRGQLLDMEKKFSEAQSAAETWQHRHGKAREENRQLKAQSSLLISQLSEQIKTLKDKVRRPGPTRAGTTEVTDQSETVRRLKRQLQESQCREGVPESRINDLNKVVADLRMKLESQGAQVALLVTRNKMHVEENRQLHQHLENLKRRT